MLTAVQIEDDKSGSKGTLLCPSAPAEWEHPKVFGIVCGTPEKPAVKYLESVQPLTAEISASISPASPGEVLRIAAPCAEHKCQHFQHGHCGLIARTITVLNPVASRLPPCPIRSTCRWWNEQGREACFRCPQVVTNSFSNEVEYVRAASPPQNKQ